MLTSEDLCVTMPTMKQKSNINLKSDALRKYVIISISFLTLLLLVLAVCSCMLLFNLYKRTPTASEIYSRSISGIVEVKATTEGVGESFGTAEFVKNDGTLVTNAHVVTYTKLGSTYEFESVFIRFATDDDYIEVSLIKYDKDLDIAVLRMNKDRHEFSSLKPGDSTKICSGDKAYAIGNSANYGLSMAEGLIGAPLINIVYGDQTRNVIQANINITDGNSGGALLDKDGRLIGITTFRTKDLGGNVIYGIAYCVPINAVLQYINFN